MTFDLKIVREQVANQCEFITDWIRLGILSDVKFYDKDNHKLVGPQDYPLYFRRLNDAYAAAYCHALAIAADNGDDCVDVYGKTMELKLAYVSAKDYTIGERGALVRNNGTSLGQAINAKFRVFEKTDSNHHNKDTALILMSYEHNTFITGFAMTGERVCELLHDRAKTTQARQVSLANFIEYGYEFGSSVPHIGWERYLESLDAYVRVREGKPTIKNCDQVVKDWIDLADVRNLQRL